MTRALPIAIAVFLTVTGLAVITGCVGAVAALCGIIGR